MAPTPTGTVPAPILVAAAARGPFASKAASALEVPPPSRGPRAVPYAKRPPAEAKATEAAPSGARPKANAAALRRRKPSAARAEIPLAEGEVPVALRPRGDVAPRAAKLPKAVLAALALGRALPTVRGVTAALPEVEGRAVPGPLAIEQPTSTGLALASIHITSPEPVPATRSGGPPTAPPPLRPSAVKEELTKALAIRALASPGPVARPLATSEAAPLAVEVLVADLAGLPAEALTPEATPLVPAPSSVRPTAPKVLATTATEAPPARVRAEATQVQVGVKLATAAKGAQGAPVLRGAIASRPPNHYRAWG